MTPLDKSAPEFEGCSPHSRSTEGDCADLQEVYKAGNLTVFAGSRDHPAHPLQLDFHYRVGSHSTAHWHGLLRGDVLFLDTPHQVLDLGSRDSLIATLEYTEEKTKADRVLVNFHKSRSDRGNLLRAFSFLGFELVQPDRPGLPPWPDVIFMAYPMERELCHEPLREACKPGTSQEQEGPLLLDAALEPP